MKKYSALFFVLSLMIWFSPRSFSQTIIQTNIVISIDLTNRTISVGDMIGVHYVISNNTNAVYILQDYHISHLQDYPEIRRRPEIKDFPAIFALGDVVLLQRDSSGSPPEINIRFGIHRRAKAIRIFPPNLDIDKAPNFRAVSAFTNESWYIRIAPNIFVER
jgi:hypothetical protein